MAVGNQNVTFGIGNKDVAHDSSGPAIAFARGVTLGDGERPVACFGEIGLTGELRAVAHADRRLAEARKFGLQPVISPEAGTLRRAIGAALGGRERTRAAA